MDLRPALQIQTMIKAMADVVIPAVDPNNKMGQEQSRLVLGMLHLMAARLPLMFRYDRAEIEQYLSLSKSLLDKVKGGARTTASVRELAAVAQTAAQVLERAGAEPTELEEAVLQLRAGVGGLVQSVYADGDPEGRAVLSKEVLAASKLQLERERSWLVPQGWEEDPSSLPAIDTLLR